MYNQTDTRLLQGDIDWQPGYERNLTIKDVLDLRVSSIYLDDDELDKNLIKDYFLTRLTSQAFDVQVEFDQSSRNDIPSNKLEPETLVIKFKDAMVFRGL